MCWKGMIKRMGRWAAGRLSSFGHHAGLTKLLEEHNRQPGQVGFAGRLRVCCQWGSGLTRAA